MAVEFGPRGINVNAINGGLIDTESCAYFYENVPGMAPIESVLSKIPKATHGHAARGRRRVAFLLAPESEYITGPDDLRRRRFERHRAAVLRRHHAAALTVTPMCSNAHCAPGASARCVLPIASSWARCTWGSRPTARALAAFYAQRARGGAGLIVTGGSCVNRAGAGGRNYSFINEDSSNAPLRAAVERVHAAGGRIALQLFHAGPYASTRRSVCTPVAPSADCVALFAGSAARAGGRGDRATIARFRAAVRCGARARIRRGRGDGVGGISAQPVSLAADKPARRRVGRRLRTPHAHAARGAARDSRACGRRVSRDLSHLRCRPDARSRRHTRRDARIRARRSPPTASTRSTSASAGTNRRFPPCSRSCRTACGFPSPRR